MKVFTISFIRNLDNLLLDDKISLSRYVEMLNEHIATHVEKMEVETRALNLTVDNNNVEIKALRKALTDLVEATEDKNGQFSAWHKHLRAQTQAAKLLLLK